VLLGLVAASLAVGWLSERESAEDINWEVAALVFTGLATLALAFATRRLAGATRDDVGESHRIAEAAVHANELARRHEETRPRLSLRTDDEKIQTHDELGAVHVRVFVRNDPGLRASQGTRVLVDRVFKPFFDPEKDKPVTLGSPALGWTSAAAGDRDESVVIFSGAERVIDLGQIFQDPDTKTWREFEIWLPQLKREGVVIADRRQVVGTGTTIRLVVGSDEADARVYDVLVGWSERAADAASVVSSVAVRIEEVDPLLPHSIFESTHD
jgi:hypothetical protein